MFVSIVNIFGINRNILECKDERTHSRAEFMSLVLIETYWNVKMAVKQKQKDSR